MPLEVILLIMRVLIALTLYTFLGLLLLVIWRDMRLISQQTNQPSHSLGSLVVVECDPEVGLAIGQRYPLRPLTTLGRGPTNTIALPDNFVSTSHAQIVLQRGQWWLTDLQSRNGTTLNGIPILEAVVLSSGDIIGVGRTQLKLELEQK